VLSETAAEILDGGGTAAPQPTASTEGTEGTEGTGGAHFVIIASRSGPRYLSNLGEVVALLEGFVSNVQDMLCGHSHPLTPLDRCAASKLHRHRHSHARWIGARVISVDFGKLSPCEQIYLMQRAIMFVFVHGAEGALLPFLKPGSLVVEMHPGGCCLHDFSDYERYFAAGAEAAGAVYHFYSGTSPASWHCLSWQNHLMVSPFCGVYVIPHLFVDLLHSIEEWIH
jgi:hypothetical protein